jgi:propanediol dehydratase large subunit
MPRVTIEIEDKRIFNLDEVADQDLGVESAFIAMLIKNRLYLDMDMDPDAVAGYRVSVDTVAVPRELIRALAANVASGSRDMVFTVGSAIVDTLAAQQPVA